MDSVVNFWRWIHLLDGGTLCASPVWGLRVHVFICMQGMGGSYSCHMEVQLCVEWCVWILRAQRGGLRQLRSYCLSIPNTASILCSVVLGLGLCKPHYLGQLTLTIRGTRERLGGRRSGDFLLPLLVSLSVQHDANGWCQPPAVFLHSQTSFTVSRKR